jgi:formate dehydrogenase iron-sulfur subunit
MGHSLAILDNAPLGHLAQEATQGPDVIGGYLRAQADLSAVEKFSQKHEDMKYPLQEAYYKALLPTSKPATGEQYAFEVDLDLCTGCKGCVTACKSLNGLGEDESWRDVGMIHGQGLEPAVQHVTTACHHCLEPACLTGCPVNAYVKLEDSGIVKHLDDQCIGCQYCTLTCPYDVPKFSKQLGIVRKCDMCVGRLENSEAPACVQACPNEAIRITVVSHDDVWAQAEAGMVVPGTPPSDITFPTTRFKTSRAQVRELVPADYDQPQKEHAHAPLLVMLVLTQIAAGVFIADHLSGWIAGQPGGLGFWGSAVGFGVCCLALAASILHLGRPQYA